MEPKLLLVNAITLLFLESQIQGSTDNSADLVNKVLASIKVPEVSLDLDRGRDVVIGLRQTASLMSKSPPGTPFIKSEILQRIRVNCGDESSLYNAFVDGFDDTGTEEELKTITMNYRNTLNGAFKQAAVTAIIKQASQNALFNADQINWQTFVRDVMDALEPHTGTMGGIVKKGLVDSVSLGDSAKLKEVMTKAVEESTASGILKLGWQGINRMLGEYAGMRRGDFGVVGALQHNFKSGWVLSIFKHWALYNVPYMLDNKKKPMLLFISFENSLTDNIMWLYSSLKENETGQVCDTYGVDIEEASAYVTERMQATGYTVHMARYDPSDFTYRDLFDIVLDFESQGYEIHGMVVDYLNMMSKAGCTAAGNGADIRDLFRRVRNFTSPRAIAFFTPHQLSPEAKYLLRQGADGFVKEVANKGYWDSCKAIDQEVDLEIIIHIEKHMGESYLTVQRGKHRKVKITPEKDLYCVLKFEAVGGIRDDVEGRDLSRRSIGGSAMADGGEAAWWEVSKAA